uniref:Uncharacterized protein n=1 Tax=Anguilla anguilla TaxID=7936 RepID=A0A0E9VYI2_ANGAN
MLTYMVYYRATSRKPRLASARDQFG